MRRVKEASLHCLISISRITSHYEVIHYSFISAFAVLRAVTSLGPITCHSTTSLKRQLKLVDVKMLQRQIMFKQLQELQRRQQLQELTPDRDSRMPMFDNMHMIQQGESSIFQGSPSGLFFSQGQSNALGNPLGMSSPQFDMSLYGNPASNADKNLNLYPYPQDPSNFSENLSTKQHNSRLGMSTVDPSSVARSFMSQQGNFSVDQGTVSDGSLFREQNLFGQVPFHNSNSNLVSLSYSPHGITTQRSTSEGRLEDTGWPCDSLGEVSKVDMSEASATLDPLEQKILYSSDDHDWSALMQSALTETSSGGTVVQEEWSGLSFQNPEPSSDNHPSNLSTGEKLLDNWVDRNLQNVSSPSSEPNMNHSFPGSQNSGQQFLTQKDEFQCESSHASGQGSPRTVSQLTDYNSQLKHPTGRDQLVQTSLLPEHNLTAQYNENFKNDHELEDTLWRSSSASGGLGTPFGQFSQPNFQGYSVESEKMGPGDNVDRSSAHLASDLYSQNVAAQSTLPNSQEFDFRLGPVDSRTPQSFTHSPTFPMRVGFPRGLPLLGPNIIIQQDESSPRANKFSSSLFRTPGSASSSPETNPRTPEQGSLNFSKHERNVGYHEQRLEHNPTPLSSNTDSQQSSAKHYLEVDGVTSGSYTRHASPQPSDQVEQKDVATPVVSVSDSRGFSHPLHQNHSMLHQYQRSTDGQTISGKRFPFNYQQDTANARELLLSGQNVAGQDKSTSSIGGVQLGAFSPANNTENFIVKDSLVYQPAKASSSGYLQSSKQMVMIGQNDSQSHSIDSKEASNVAYQFHTSLQMAPSWIKQYEDLKNGKALPTYHPKAATAEMPSFSQSNIGNIPENRLNMQVGSAKSAEESGGWPVRKHLASPSVLPSDFTCQNLAITELKKRKIVKYDLEPWHKELNSEAPRPQNISVAEFEWAQALNRRHEEVKYEADIIVDVLPVVRAKRRLIYTTQLMQQVFRPSVADILVGDDSSICVAYSAARSTLGDACNLKIKMTPDSNYESPDKLNTSKRTTPCDFAKIVECLICRAEKLEGDLSRLDQCLSAVDIQVESQELEKFSIYNRFAKFHFKMQSSIGEPVRKPNPQRYVIAAPMPKLLPEDRECISL